MNDYEILTPKDTGFLVEVPASQNDASHIPHSIPLHRFPKIAFITEIKDPFYNEFLILLASYLGNVPFDTSKAIDY